MIELLPVPRYIECEGCDRIIDALGGPWCGSCVLLIEPAGHIHLELEEGGAEEAA